MVSVFETLDELVRNKGGSDGWLEEYLYSRGILSQKDDEGRLTVYADQQYSAPDGEWRNVGNHIIKCNCDGIQIVAAGMPQAYPESSYDDFIPKLANGIYDIYAIPFIGTLCWLWFDTLDQHWYLGSKRSSNLIGVSWRKGRESFDVAFAKALPDDFNWSILNKQYTYSFLLHSHDIHLFTPSSMSNRQLLFVGARRNEINSPIEYPDIGVPRQKPIITKAKLSLKECIALYAKMATSIAHLEESNEVCLGYIFRPHKHNSICEHVLVKSQLHAFIDTVIGEFSDIRDAVHSSIYMPKSKSEQMRKIFPDLKDTFDKVENTINNLIDTILSDELDGNDDVEQIRIIIMETVQPYAIKDVDIRRQVVYDAIRNPTEDTSNQDIMRKRLARLIRETVPLKNDE